MKAILPTAIFALIATASLHSQELVLKDGRRIPFATFSVSGATLRVPTDLAEGGKMEVGYPLSSIATIDAEEPAEIRSAKSLLGENKPAEARAMLRPVLQLYGPVKDLPGQWWAEAALVQADALRISGDRSGAAQVYDEITTHFPVDTQPGALAALRKLALSDQLHGVKLSESVTRVAEALKDPDPHTKAELKFLTARALSQQDRFREAAEGFLGIRVFYPGVKELQAAATLEAARAFFQMDDLKWTAFYLQDLKSLYPASPELAAAKDDFARLERRQNRPADTSSIQTK
ncbi:hypothetical protein TSACC_21424 [Terrimicrobium sacchariphilum]|uniref:Tetratricopeptide repeat-containing protein n=1 Tax=Terrimicrobium sacchariphilum TaxID=690879 RepID=A0A146G5C9_TERSA|nr:hypothetical protein [Terrimicrobium sacchariphilum]GAT33019.1 hypothetical protein TSACC_21424 [Terrimicrobium sacchariphilum]